MIRPSSSRRFRPHRGIGLTGRVVGSHGTLGGGRRFTFRTPRRLVARRDRLQEGVLQQAAHRLPSRHFRTVHSPGDRDHGRDLAPQAVLQDLRADPDQAFVEPLAEPLLGNRLAVGAHLDPPKQRFDISLDGTALHLQLRVHRKLARGNLESAVRPDEVLQSDQVGVFDLRRNIHIGTPRPRLQAHRQAGLPATHELAGESRDGRAVPPLVAEMLDREVGIGQLQPVGRLRGLVHEPEGALHNLEPLDAELGARLRGLLRCFRGLLRPGLLRLGGMGQVQVLQGDPVHEHPLEDQPRDLRRVLDGAGQRQAAVADGQVVAIGDRLEVVEGHLVQPERGLYPHMRLAEEVGAPIEPRRARVEHHRLEVDRRGIHLLLRGNVANVLGAQIDAADVERLEGALVDIGDIPFDHAQAIDLEVERQGLQRLLPAAILQRRLLGRLGAHLLEIEIDRRAFEAEVRNDPTMEQRPPIDAGDEARHLSDRRVGVGVLGDRGVAQLDGRRPRMHAQRGDLHGMPRQATIDRRLHIAAQRLIREPGSTIDQDREQDEPPQQEDPTAANSQRHSTSLLWSTTWPSGSRTPPAAPRNSRPGSGPPRDYSRSSRARITMLQPVGLPLGIEWRGQNGRLEDDQHEHPSRPHRGLPLRAWRRRPRPRGCGAGLASGERRRRYLKGSLTTTLTPAMTPVTARWTCSTASWLISPAPLRAPVAAADAASSAPSPTLLAPAIAPSTAFRATSPTSPPTSAALLTRTRALVLIVPTASAPTSLVPLRTPMTPPLAVAPRSPPTWAVPVMAPRKTSETVEVSAVPTAPVPLMVLTSVPLTVSTTVVKISPVPLIEPTNVSFTDSMIPL